MSAFIGLELGYLVQELAIEVEKQRRFHQSFSALHWLHHVSILLALPWYYKYKIGDFFFGAFFLVGLPDAFQCSAQRSYANFAARPLCLAVLLTILPCRIRPPAFCNLVLQGAEYSIHVLSLQAAQCCSAVDSVACFMLLLLYARVTSARIRLHIE